MWLGQPNCSQKFAFRSTRVCRLERSVLLRREAALKGTLAPVEWPDVSKRLRTGNTHIQVPSVDRRVSKRERVPVDWRGVQGRRLRQLLRHIEHTHAVHAYLASTILSARSEGWEIAQLEPPHRAARHFRHEDGPRSVHPDAFLMLSRGGDQRAFFLELERRAVRPSTMRQRFYPYLRYYSTTQSLDDHGVTPTVLIVVEDAIIAPHFRRNAQQEMRRLEVYIPLSIQ